MHTIELMVIIKIHMINSQCLHNLKYKVSAFDRNFHLLVPNSLSPVQSILASLDSCNQASLFCNIQLTEQISQTNRLTYGRRGIKGGKPQNSTTHLSVHKGRTSTVFTANSSQLVLYLVKLCLIVESFESFGQVYSCCCFNCDYPTEFSRNNLLFPPHIHWVCVA